MDGFRRLCTKTGTQKGSKRKWGQKKSARVLHFSKAMIGTAYSAGIFGFEASLIKVEIDTANGFPSWQIVGLPEKGVQESRERVCAALRNSGLHLEARKTTVNLAPATYKKSGTQYDLPIAFALLAAHGVLEKSLHPFLLVGELSLTGDLKPVQGALLFSLLTRQKNFEALICPKANAQEASLIKEIEVIGCANIAEVLEFIHQQKRPSVTSVLQKVKTSEIEHPDFCDVKGQTFAKRALEIAAAGGHHMIMMGPPGSGKTMLAIRFPTILPPLTEEQIFETSKIYSALGLLDHQRPLINTPPIRSPHHSISYAGLIGGGDGLLAPGEITLAHNGVLFLDELPEFRRDSLQMLRQPLESGHVTITRAKWRLKLPARFQMIAALNPCKCGYLGHPYRNCICAPGHVFQYRRKISGPLLDRIDLHVEVSVLNEREIFDDIPNEKSAAILERVMRAREYQQSRFKNAKIVCNALIPAKLLRHYCPVTDEAMKFFRKTFPALKISVRAHDKILKIARTLADLEGQEMIATGHIAEAIQYRLLDREGGV